MYSFREVDPSVLDNKMTFKVKKTEEVSENSDIKIIDYTEPVEDIFFEEEEPKTGMEGYYSTSSDLIIKGSHTGTDHNYIRNQKAKADYGKPRLSLVPSEIIFEIAKVREFGNSKYGDPENWRDVEIERYRDAAYRHLLRYIQDPKGLDEESGLSHLAHLACNIAFLCELEKE